MPTFQNLETEFFQKFNLAALSPAGTEIQQTLASALDHADALHPREPWERPGSAWNAAACAFLASATLSPLARDWIATRL